MANQNRLLENYIYSRKKEEEPRDCFVVCDETRMITYRHVDHNDWEIGHVVDVWKVKDPDALPKKVKVVHFCNVAKEGERYTPHGDFVILELVNGEFEHFPPAIDKIGVWDEYLKIGFNENGQLICDRGIIRKEFGSWLEGSTSGKAGNSGSGVFTLSGKFAGIVVANSKFNFDTNTDSINSLVQNASEHVPRELIVATEVYSYLVEHQKVYPSAKKPKQQLYGY